MTKREQLADYYAFLRDNVEEVQSLFGDLLISVTFFRDRKAFEALAKHVLPQLFDGKEASDCIRVWVPGCATGEEAYTIAILLLEEAARHDIRPQVGFSVPIWMSAGLRLLARVATRTRSKPT